MRRRLVMALFLTLGVTPPSWALDAVGTIKRIDAEKGVLVVFANGRDRDLIADKALRVLDQEGKDLPDGLKSPELKVDAQVNITVEPTNGRNILKAIRLGAAGGRGPRRDGNDPRRKSGDKLGFKPLNEMTAEEKYLGEEGGLYGKGENVPPGGHRAAAEKETAQIIPRDGAGKPSKSGKIALISISMSNWTQEFSKFKQIADRDPDKSPLVTIVDCAQGGQTMARWADARANPWSVAEERLTHAGVTPAQVQVAWIKIANAGPTGELEQHGKQLQQDTVAVLQNARARYDDIGQHNGRREQGAGGKTLTLIFRQVVDGWIIKTVKPKD